MNSIVSFEKSNKKTAPGPPEGMPVPWKSPDLPEVVRGLFKQYGPVLRIQTGDRIFHLLSHPDHVRYVLLDPEKNFFKGKANQGFRSFVGEGVGTSEGELWQRQRRMLQPMHGTKEVSVYDAAIAAAAREIAAVWDGTAGEFDVNEAMSRLSMDVICRVIFGTQMQEEHKLIRKGIDACLDFISRSIDAGDDLERVREVFQSATNDVETLIQKFLSDETLSNEHSLLGKMARARHKESGEPMPRRQLGDEVLTIFFSGYEAITQTLTWLWFFIAKHPIVERKFHAELSQFPAGHEFTAKDLPKLVYTRMILDETLRLHPQGWILTRDVERDDEIGGYHIPAGSTVRVVPYATHRQPELWDDPERFEPDRFLSEKAAGRHAFAYYPFGGGRRYCMGKNFTMLEIPLVMAILGTRFRLRLAPDCKVKPMVIYSYMRPDGPVPMVVEKRK